MSCDSSNHISWNVTLKEHVYNSYTHKTSVTYHVNVANNKYNTINTGVCSEHLDTDRPFIDTFYLIYDGCCMEPNITTVTSSTVPSKEYGFRFIKLPKLTRLGKFCRYPVKSHPKYT